MNINDSPSKIGICPMCPKRKYTFTIKAKNNAINISKLVLVLSNSNLKNIGIVINSMINGIINVSNGLMIDLKYNIQTQVCCYQYNKNNDDYDLAIFMQ